MIRWVFVISMLFIGWHYGGLWGIYTMLLLSAVILAPIAWNTEPQAQPRQRVRQIQSADDFSDEVVVGGIKGHRDPTRPDQEDYAAMITNNYGKRKA